MCCTWVKKRASDINAAHTILQNQHNCACGSDGPRIIGNNVLFYFIFYYFPFSPLCNMADRPRCPRCLLRSPRPDRSGDTKCSEGFTEGSSFGPLFLLASLRNSFRRNYNPYRATATVPLQSMGESFFFVRCSSEGTTCATGQCGGHSFMHSLFFLAQKGQDTPLWTHKDWSGH